MQLTYLFVYLFFGIATQDCTLRILPLCFLNYSPMFPELFPYVSWIIPLGFLNYSTLFPELFPSVSWIIPLCFLNYSPLFPEFFPSVSWIIPLCFLNYSPLFPELFPSVSWIIPLCFLNYSRLFPGFQSKQKNDRVIRSSVVKHNSLLNFRCAIPVVFIYTEGMCILSKSQHNLIFVFLLFKLTTCFGLCF